MLISSPSLTLLLRLQLLLCAYLLTVSQSMILPQHREPMKAVSQNATSTAAGAGGVTTAAAEMLSAAVANMTTPGGAGEGVVAGVDILSAWDRALLIATIVLFVSLSVVSGRVLWKQYAATHGLLRSRANSASSAVLGGGNGSNALNKGLYSTPRNGGHSSFSGLPPQVPTGGSGASAVVTSSTGLLEDESSASASTGSEMRQRFFLLLFVASILRVFSLVTEVTTLSVVTVTTPASFYNRLLTMFLWLPSLLFVTMYGLVLLFLAQLCYACWGKAYPWPRRIFFAFNVALYVAFFALFAAIRSTDGFRKACDLMLGSVYFLGLFGILYYSIRLIYFFRSQSPDEDFFFDLPSTANQSLSPRQVVLRRVRVRAAGLPS